MRRTDCTNVAIALLRSARRWRAWLSKRSAAAALPLAASYFQVMRQGANFRRPWQLGPRSYRYKQALGRRGERAARRFLARQGYWIWSSNWRTPSGELDIIAVQRHTLAFVEVKTLSSRSLPYCRPDDHVDFRKQCQLRRLAQLFVDRYYPLIKAKRLHVFRFDVVAVCWEPRLWLPPRLSIVHIADAFDWDLAAVRPSS